MISNNLYGASKTIFANIQKIFNKNAFTVVAFRNTVFGFQETIIHSTVFGSPSLSVRRFISKWQRFPKLDKPVDWLPFPWENRPKFDLLENSGDLVKTNEIDLSLPKPLFESSEELKRANEHIKRMFSLRTASKVEIVEAKKKELLKQVQRHPMDFNSLEVRIALKTIRVRQLYQRRDEEKRKFVQTKVALMLAIQKRNKLLKTLYRIDVQRFMWLKKLIQVEYEPPALGFIPEKYTKESDLQRLTREYCEQLKQNKRCALNEELKSQKDVFLAKREETLAWIVKEETVLSTKLANDEKLRSMFSNYVRTESS